MVVLELAGEHADEAQVADELVVDHLEDLGDELFLLGRFELVRLPFGADLQAREPLAARSSATGRICSSASSSSFDAHVLLGRRAEDRDERAGVQRPGDVGFQFRDRDVAFASGTSPVSASSASTTASMSCVRGRLRIDRAALAGCPGRVEQADDRFEVGSEACRAH